MRNFALLALLSLCAACGVFDSGQDARRIRLSEITADADLKIPAGQVVVFENDLQTDHSITSPIGLWDSGRIRPGHTYAYQFNEPGEFSFLSVFDPEIEGTLHVEGN